MRHCSPKRARQERVYLARRRVFLAANPRCARCGARATEVHHRAGRDGFRLLHEPWWLPVCARCHKDITEHPADALANGWSLPRIGAAS